MRLTGEKYSKRLECFSTYTMYLFGLLMSAPKDVYLKANDIISDSWLSESEVRLQFIDLLNSFIGKNNNLFENNIFTFRKWLAPSTEVADVIENIFTSMKLVGRRIQDVRIFGLSYFHTKDWIEEGAYNSLPDYLSEEEKQEKSKFKNISNELEYGRNAIIDEPFLIKFDDGDIFEIITPRVSQYMFSMNCIPWDIKSGCQENNIDTSILFEPFLGKRIVEIEVSKEYTSTDPMLNCKFDEEGTMREIVTRVVLWLEDGIGICISGWIDYCDIACINRNNELVPITFGELKKALKN